MQGEIRRVRTSVRTHVTYVDVEINYPDETPPTINNKPREAVPKWRLIMQKLKERGVI
jgi:tRNA U34 5-carboxymethylaminomethyl modifying GTPase MnmE/TrmE